MVEGKVGRIEQTRKVTWQPGPSIGNPRRAALLEDVGEGLGHAGRDIAACAALGGVHEGGALPQVQRLERLSCAT